MASRKIAISMRLDVLLEADRMAKQIGKSRSAFLAELVSRAAKELRDREITEALNRVFTDASARREQIQLSGETYLGEVFGDDTEW